MTWLVRRKKEVFQIFAGCALVAALTTHWVVTQASLDTRNLWLLPLVILDVFFIVSFCIILIVRALEIWGNKKQLSKQIYGKHILLFTSVLTLPVLLIFIFNATFMHQGIQTWFSEPIRNSLEISRKVAQAYIDENFNAMNMASSSIISRMREYFIENKNLNTSEKLMLQTELPTLLYKALDLETSMFSLSEAMIVDQNMNPLAKIGHTSVNAMDIYDVLTKQESKTVRNGNHLYVVSPIGTFNNLFLMLVVGRTLAPEIVKNVDHALDATKNFTGLETQKENSKITLTLLMGLLTLLTVLIAIWFGFILVEWLMKPISDLISTAIKVKLGNWSVRAQLPPGRNELGALTKTFNMMLDHIYQQHESIISEKDVSDTIIAHISQGVLLMDKDGVISKFNKTAMTILGIEALSDVSLQDLSLELYTAFQQYNKTGIQKLEIYMNNPQGFRRLQVYVGMLKHEPVQYLMLFDDVTDLLAAQKQASWRDISKRIAHEIKNPLTPIQLSAERLRRKILQEFPKEQQEMFTDYLDVVSRQVQTIANLVRELTSFSQATSLQMQNLNLVGLCRQVVTFYQSSHHDFDITFSTAYQDLFIQGEETQLQQVLNNLLTNSILTLKEYENQAKVIKVGLTANSQTVTLEIRDNGPGFDKDIMHKLAEPYVTKRKGGTGIGLAVVAKILHDHDASLRFSNAEEGGAVVKIGFKRGEHRVTH